MLFKKSTVKSGEPYEYTDTYIPAVRFHPGIYVGSGSTASWSYVQKSFSSGDITSCA